MLVAVIAGAFAFVSLGRDEDPTFTIKTMLVTAVWPGATMDETQNQLDRPAGAHGCRRRPGSTRCGRSPGRASSRSMSICDGAFPPERVGDVWQEVRNSIGDIRHTLPQGVLGPFFNDDFGDVFGIVYGFTADGFTDRELRDYVDGVRSALHPRRRRHRARSSSSARRTRRSSSSSSPTGWRPWASTTARSSRPSPRRTSCARRASSTAGWRTCRLRVSGAFENEADILDVPLMPAAA